MSEHEQADSLSLFLNMDDKAVERDLAMAVENFEQVASAVTEYRSIASGKQTAEQTADYYHQLMLEAFIFSRLEGVPEDLALFSADMAVDKIVDQACMNALQGPGSLGALNEQMTAIERREGLGERDFWSAGEGPPDFEVLQDESDRMFDEIGDVLRPHVFERYRLHDYLKLYEEDRMTYEVMREAGRRAIFARKIEDGDHNFAEEDLLARYGPEALNLLKERMEYVSSRIPRDGDR